MALPKITLSIDQLIRDPNNPRFSKNESDIIHDQNRYEDDDIQDETLRKMISENEFDISGLEKSMKENGFISVVQPILVKKIKDRLVELLLSEKPIFETLLANDKNNSLKLLSKFRNSKDIMSTVRR